MEWGSWLFSAKRAWQNSWAKWMTVATIIFVIFGSGLFVGHMMFARRAGGMIVMHYTIYFGVDAVRPWAWILFLPAAWILLTALDLLLAFGYYREDPYFALSLFFLAFAWSLPWMGTLWYLTRVNV